VVLLVSVGAAVGLAVRILEQQRSVADTGWTFYQPLQPRYADYLSTRHAAWWPSLAVYLGVGLVGGLLIAAVLVAFGFRLSRVRRAPRPSRNAEAG
jgi:hypothetical protein